MTVSLILILKNTGLSRLLALKVFGADKNKDIRGDKADKTVVNLLKSKKSKNIKSKKQTHIKAKEFLIFNAKITFI